MNEFKEIKAELMKESLEDLLEQVFSGSYVPGPTEAAIREKVKECVSYQKPIKVKEDCLDCTFFEEDGLDGVRGWCKKEKKWLPLSEIPICR